MSHRSHRSHRFCFYFSQNRRSSESRVKLVWTMPKFPNDVRLPVAFRVWGRRSQIADSAESSEQWEQSQMHLSYVESRRTSLKANVVMRTRIARITLILYLSLAEIAEIAEILFFRSHGNHGNRGNFLMDTLMVVDVFLKINFHHTSLTSMLDSSWRVNQVFHLIRRILRTSS